MADFCHSMDCSPPGSSVHGVFQERILEGLPFPPPEHLPNPGMEPVAPALADRFFPTPTPGKLYFNQANCSKSSGLELSCFKKSQLYNNWKILQETIVLSCVQLCVYKYCSPPGSSVHGIFQARIPEWVVISFSRGSSWLRGWTRVFCVFCISCMGRWILYHWAPGKPS